MSDAKTQPPAMSKVFTIDVMLRPPVVLSGSPTGRRTFIPIVGGSVVGSRLQGSIVDGGGDWAFERADGAMSIHARYLLRTSDGVMIEVDNVGRWRERPGCAPYFVTAPVFVAGDGPYDWLCRGVFVGMGHEVDETRIVIDVYAAEDVSP